MASTKRKRGGRTPRVPRVETSPAPADPADSGRGRRKFLIFVVALLLLQFAFGEFLPSSTWHGMPVSDRQNRLATLFALPCALIPGIVSLLRSRPGWLYLAMPAIVVIAVSRWETLNTSVSALQLGIRWTAVLVASFACYQQRKSEAATLDQPADQSKTSRVT